MKISNFLKQENHQLITTKPMVLTIDLSNYDSSSLKFEDDDKKIWVKSLLAKAEYKDFMFDITLDYALKLFVYDIETF